MSSNAGQVATGLAVLLLVISRPSGAQAAPAAAAPSAAATALVQSLAWMAGCWQRKTASGVVEEQWMVPRGNTLMGMGRTTAGDRVREFEFLRVFVVRDSLVYGSTPSGQAYSEFRAAGTSNRTIVFENPTHDFPQRIGYRAVGNDSLLAYIEGTRSGQVRRIDFPYSRVACPAP